MDGRRSSGWWRPRASSGGATSRSATTPSA
jgi:hypothetical protein